MFDNTAYFNKFSLLHHHFPQTVIRSFVNLTSLLHAGLIPYNLISVQAGLVLSELQGLSLLDLKSVLGLIAAAGSLLGTALVARWLKSRTAKTKQS